MAFLGLFFYGGIERVIWQNSRLVTLGYVLAWSEPLGRFVLPGVLEAFIDDLGASLYGAITV